MEQQRNSRAEAPVPAPDETRWRKGFDWLRRNLDRLRRSRAVRMHFRHWLLGLVSFGSIR